MKKTQSYYGFKNNQVNTGYEKYTPGVVGKIAVGITTPSVIVAFISILVTLFGVPEAMIVALITFVISFVGSIVIMIDIVIFNYKQKHKSASAKDSGAKQPDIMRIVHMLIGIVVGIIIGYLIWGGKY